MELNRSMTATVYVVYQNKVLLHQHKKFGSLFPLGGHLHHDELPQEAALREVYEESGLHVTLYNPDEKLPLPKGVQLDRPSCLYLENDSTELQNIDFIYFALASGGELNPQAGESRNFCWLTQEQLLGREDIKPHIRETALKALRTLAVEKDPSVSFQQIKDKVTAFLAERDWLRYQDPKSLSMSIAIEAAELMEIFQWCSTQEAEKIAQSEEFIHMQEELADVLIYCFSLATHLNLDVVSIIEDKFVKNARKYPVPENL